MGKSLATILLTLLLVAGPGPLLAPAAADLPPPEPPGTHGQNLEASVDLGAWKDYTVRIVRVEAGDTLGGIARKHLGSYTRWKEIRFEDPVEPTALEVGSEALLPPRGDPLPPGSAPDPARPEAREWWDFFVLRGYGSKLVRYRRGADPAISGSVTELVAIRHDRVADVLERVQDDPAGVDAALQALAPTSSDWLARSGNLQRWVRVKDEDPVYRVKTHKRVVGMEEGRLVLETVSQQLLGADGRELPKSSTPPPAALAETADVVPESAGPSARWDLILTFLALLGAIGIAVVYAQRARLRAASRPTSPPGA